MSGKEAAPALSVEIDDGAIPMEENRSWLPVPARSAGGLPARPAKRRHSSCLACGVLRVVEADYTELECLWNAAAVSEPESELQPGSERNFKKIRIN